MIRTAATTVRMNIPELYRFASCKSFNTGRGTSFMSVGACDILEGEFVGKVEDCDVGNDDKDEMDDDIGALFGGSETGASVGAGESGIVGDDDIGPTCGCLLLPPFGDGVCNGNCLKFPGAACDGLDLIRGIVNIETPSPKGGNTSSKASNISARKVTSIDRKLRL